MELRESEEGCVEYKLKLVEVDEKRLEELASQLKYRLSEGGGEAIYEIGVSDQGEPLGINEEEARVSLRNLERAAHLVGARCTVLRESTGRAGKVLEILVRRTREDFPINLIVPAIGNVDSGKSTLIGALVMGTLDDGNGALRSEVCRYLHELVSGRTSSTSFHALGFDERGDVVNYALPNPRDEAEVFIRSAKVVTLIDLGGHERYLRTTLKGIMGSVPDYAILCVAASDGVKPMTKEHLGVAVALKIPVFIAVTKVDAASEVRLQETLQEIHRVLKLPGVSKIPFLVKSMDDVAVAAKNMAGGRIAPIFLVSSKTGEGLELLTKFLNLLPPRLRWFEKLDEPFLVYVDDKFNVTGVGPVVSGLVLSGSVSVNDKVYLGPFLDGSFRIVRIRSMQVNRVFVDRVHAGQEATFALSNIFYDELRKGMVLAAEKPYSVWEFEADILVLYHSTTIRRGYQAVVHVQTIRQAAEFVEMSKEPLRTGDRAHVKLRFLYRPEHLRVGQRILFREGRTRGIGTITSITRA